MPSKRQCVKRVTFHYTAVEAFSAPAPPLVPPPEGIRPEKYFRNWRNCVSWVKFAIGLLPQTYAMLADDGVRYDMGKKRAGQAESIMAMELVMAELERRRIPAAQVREAYLALRARNTPLDEVPYDLAAVLFDDETQDRLFKHMRAL